MSKFSAKQKIITAILSSVVVGITLPIVTYLSVLPYVVKNQNCLNFVEKTINKYTGYDLKLQNPSLKTSWSPIIEIKTDSFQLSKDNAIIFSGQNFDTNFSLKDVFKKRLILNKFGVDYLFVDVNKLMNLSCEKHKPQKKSDWIIDWFDTLLYVKNSIVVYEIDENTFLKIDADKLEIDTTEDVKKHVRFNIKADLKKGKNIIVSRAIDNNSVYIKNKKLYLDNCALEVNNSKMRLVAEADEQNDFMLKVSSKNFKIKDVLNLINSNIVENNLAEPLSYFSDIDGTFDFVVFMTNDILNGKLKLNKLAFKIKPVANIPLLITQGNVEISKDVVILKNFKGIYNNKAENKINFEGKISDYLKSVDTDIVVNAVVTNDFAKNYFSKMIGYPLEIIGKPHTRLMFKAKNNIMDMIWLFKFNSDEGFKIDNQNMAPAPMERVLAANLHFEDMLLNIKSINYYMTEARNKLKNGKKPDKMHKPVPILSFNGNIDFKNDVFVKDFGFTIPNSLPSEFLNMMLKQEILKKGTISGNLSVVNTRKYPVINGHLKVEGVRVPSQRVFIKQGDFYTDSNTIHIDAKGGYRRIKYDFDGDILNEIKLPVIVKDVKLTLDNLDIERVVNTFNSQPKIAGNKGVEIFKNELSDDDDIMTFDVGNIIVQNSTLKILKGKYKNMTFGNIEAKMTLDKNSEMFVTSNKFDIAEGISTLKVICNLKKQQYYIRLGLKDVNSDVIATSLFDLKKEITGKAKGLIELNTDKTLKLNGVVKFAIENGTISKIGFVEYIMKVAALFRNPLTMISPGTISDLTNVPTGDFDTINGSLDIKNNVIENINIKSKASQLASLVVGKFDLESRDATLRIYTKFSNVNKGVYSFLRNISLNALANRIPLNNKNDSNYYASDMENIPSIDAPEKDCQIFLTKVEGDVEHNNFLSSLKKLK